MSTETNKPSNVEEASAEPIIDTSKSLAEQVAQNEVEMFRRTQQYLQQIEEEVRQTQQLVSRKEDIR
jgi:hypothetical protein